MLYSDRAELYDRIYAWKNYASGSERLCELLSASGIGPGARVLEAACGTGAYLAHLRSTYSVSGFDLSPDMIHIAAEKLPGVDLWVDDMRTVSIEEPVDALLCLFSSIGYLDGPDEVRRAARAFYDCLRPGGAVIVEPWLSPAVAVDGHISQQAYDSFDMVLTRSAIHRVEGDTSVIDFGWLVTRPDGIEHFAERHTMWLVEPDVLVALFAEVGFEARWESEGLTSGRGLLVGSRPDRNVD